MTSEVGNNFIFETSVIVTDIELNFPRVKLEKIAELKRLDPTLTILTKLVDIFFNETLDRLPEMKNFSITQDFKNLSCVIHRFKSTTYNLGASRAVELIGAIENAILRKASTIEINQLIAVLHEECVETHEVLLASCRIGEA